MSRLKVAAANWKMNTTLTEGKVLMEAMMKQDIPSDIQAIFCVPATHLNALAAHIASASNVFLGAQDLSAHESGAFTGELSAAMLKDAGASHVIIGHSERRAYHKESDAILTSKLNRALEHKLIPIFCCGEELAIRKAGEQTQHVINQLDNSLSGFSEDDLSQLIIAYEPVWAIGTGETATPVQAQEMQEEIRAFLKDKFSGSFAAQIPILYGGSVKPNNANEIFKMKDVDGGLVGGASLKADSFGAIMNSF